MPTGDGHITPTWPAFGAGRRSDSAGTHRLPPTPCSMFKQVQLNKPKANPKSESSRDRQRQFSTAQESQQRHSFFLTLCRSPNQQPSRRQRLQNSTLNAAWSRIPPPDSTQNPFASAPWDGGKIRPQPALKKTGLRSQMLSSR